jgi:hypothetical protein
MRSEFYKLKLKTHIENKGIDWYTALYKFSHQDKWEHVGSIGMV